MPIDIYPTDSHHAVMMEFNGTWDNAEFRQKLMQVSSLADDHSETVRGVIVWLHENPSYPPAGAMTHFKVSLDVSNSIPLLFVGAASYVERIFETLKKVYGSEREIHYMHTLPDALAHLTDDSAPSAGT